MKPLLNIILLGLALSSDLRLAQAGTISITFDEAQLVNNDPIEQFYNAGNTHRGIGPGPDLGVVFSLNARVFTETSGLVGTFTTPGIMELFSDTAREGEPISATMDVASAFGTSVSFDYAAIDSAGELKVYSGAHGTGTVLADVTLPVTSPQSGPGVFVADTVTFSGAAHSIVFTGGNKQIAFDDLVLTTTSVPEPPAWSVFSISGTVCLMAFRLRMGWGAVRH